MMITAVKDLIQKVGTRDPSWDRFGFSFYPLTDATRRGEQIWKTSTVSLRFISDQYPNLASHYSRKIAERTPPRSNIGQTRHKRWKKLKN
jgi:hypothetical protein